MPPTSPPAAGRTPRGRSPTARRRCRPLAPGAVAVEVVDDSVDDEVPADQDPGRIPRPRRTGVSGATTDRPGGAPASRVRLRAGTTEWPVKCASHPRRRQADGRAAAAATFVGGRRGRRGGPVGPRRVRHPPSPAPRSERRADHAGAEHSAVRPGSRSARCVACTGCPRSPTCAAAHLSRQVKFSLTAWRWRWASSPALSVFDHPSMRVV